MSLRATPHSQTLVANLKDTMKPLFILMIFFSLNSFGQDQELLQQMIQGCLSDSTFKYTVLNEPDHKCIDKPTYSIPYGAANYTADLELDLTFNGASLHEHYYSDSTKCFPFQISFLQKSKSRYEISVSYIISIPLSCEHLEGHGKNHGCFSRKVISIRRKIKIKRNGDWKIRDTQYYNRIMSGTFL
ncbi:hypothetical protein [Croceimicrobium hydrocarbonivorans]|uniref:Uncharacterized protein n=1 Tax=Croceimicrobium hydrocarbonivorans TaxID=2761580 RepID=A0A7H0VHC9_9FLAO|nr:hypothetical protein [Croceimicrobium hydrocarbonivorans]QNR25127.1 hypothetical protein H4K34_04625 [Croceimicrobium hydrocarbonivorans]